MRYILVLPALSLLVPAHALAGIWVGTPVGGVVAPSAGFTLSRAELTVSAPVLEACEGPDLLLDADVFDLLDGEADLEIPEGCWTELRVPVQGLVAEGEAQEGAFALDLPGWVAIVSLDDPQPGPLTLSFGESGWLSPVFPYLGEELLEVTPTSSLGGALRDNLAAETLLW